MYQHALAKQKALVQHLHALVEMKASIYSSRFFFLLHVLAKQEALVRHLRALAKKASNYS